MNHALRWGMQVLVGLCCSPALMADGPDFVRDVRPILERNCFQCHGPDKQKNGYRLDFRDRAIRGGDNGERAIVPHHADQSPLIRYVSADDAAVRMPPVDSGLAKLTQNQIDVLRAWIDAGPQYPADATSEVDPGTTHWSLQPLDRPKLPLPGHPIDAFIRSTLDEKRLSMSPMADRRTLMRRVAFDLHGLPPAPEDIDQFVADNDPMAYEKLVDRLLASPQYGERWARHWLDTIHFAESHGYEHDVGRDHAWRYRDYVIAALNNDTPWQRFIREQLAADQFYPDRIDLIPALGFLGAGTWDLSTFSTGPVTFDYLDRDDMVTQTMAAFVSTTANCARCHAHKFDPITHEDYYALQAVFAGITKGDLLYDDRPETAFERNRLNDLQAAAIQRNPQVVLKTEYEPIVNQWISRQNLTTHWVTLTPSSLQAQQGSMLTLKGDGIVVSEGSLPETDTYTIVVKSPGDVSAMRLEVLAVDGLPMRGPGRQGNGNLHLSELEIAVTSPDQSETTPVKIARAAADFNQDGWKIDHAIDGKPETAWGIYPAIGQTHQAVFEFQEPVKFDGEASFTIRLKQLHGRQHLIGAFRISVTNDRDACGAVLPVDLQQALVTPVGERNETQRILLASHALRLRAESALKQLPPPTRVFAAGKSVELVNGGATSVRTLAEPKVVNLLHRGEFDKPRAAVEPGSLSAIRWLPARFNLSDSRDEGLRRAALADWIAHHDNPLTWRSIVNRVWHYHFGRGLCDTPSDLGQMGGAPSHVELINWLAVWFRDDAQGSFKQLHRLILTSDAYRQSSQHRGDAATIDGSNRWLWRQQRQRMDAEAFHDSILAVSGRLDLTMGGPSIRYFKTSPGRQVTPVLDYSGFDWERPGVSRRSIYRFVWRGIADPFFDALDFPDLGLLAPSRSFSSSALQSLTLFNNDFVMFHSQALAQRAESQSIELDRRLNLIGRWLWLRELTDDERVTFKDFASRHGLAALCRLLLNSNEFLFVD